MRKKNIESSREVHNKRNEGRKKNLARSAIKRVFQLKISHFILSLVGSLLLSVLALSGHKHISPSRYSFSNEKKKVAVTQQQK